MCFSSFASESVKKQKKSVGSFDTGEQDFTRNDFSLNFGNAAVEALSNIKRKKPKDHTKSQQEPDQVVEAAALKLEKHLLEMEKEWSETSSMKRRVRKYQRKHNEGERSFQFLVESFPFPEMANKTSGESSPNEEELSNASSNMLLP